NDSLGHSAGDAVLTAVAERLAGAVRPGDTVARFGGDEFVVCCEGIDGEAGALEVAERLRHALAPPVRLDGREVFVAASIGIRLADAAEADPGDVIRDADAAMYQAKSEGRGTVAVFTEPLLRQTQRRLAVESGLHRALERGEFRIHYQPT